VQIPGKLTPFEYILAHSVEPSLQIDQQRINLNRIHPIQPSAHSHITCISPTELLTNAVNSCGLVTFPTPLAAPLPPRLGLIPSSSDVPNPSPTLPLLLPLGVPSLGEADVCLIEFEGASAGDEAENASRSCWTEGEGAAMVGERGGSEGEAGGAGIVCCPSWL